jgi:MFS family permease
MRSDLLKIYTYRFFDELILVYAFYAVMFTDSGVGPTGVGILLATWSMTAFLLEVPSGVFADKYSRKNILLLGQILKSLCYLSWLLFPTFWGFLIGFILWGVESALTSGTFEALLYDLLKKEGASDRYSKVLGFTKVLARTGFLAASALAAITIQFGYPVILIFSIISPIIAGVAIVSLKPVEIKKSTEEAGYFNVLKSGIKTVGTNPRLIYIISFLVFMYGIGGALDEYWPVFAKAVGSPDYGIAIFVGACSVMEIIGNLIAHKLEKLPNKAMYSLFILMGILIVASAYIFNLISLALLVLYCGIDTILKTVYESKLQHQIPDETRATVSSVNGFFIEVMVFVVFIGFGAIANYTDYGQAFMVFGYVTVFIGIVYVLRSVIFGNLRLSRD